MAGTCTIACKLPNGLWADLIDMDDAHATEVGRAGEVMKIRPVLGRVFFRGSAAQRRVERAADDGRISDAEPVSSVSSGFGLTHGVDLDFARAWFEQNKLYPPVAKGLIFMSLKGDSARDQARDQAEIKNGFEPINPAKPAPDVIPDERHKAA